MKSDYLMRTAAFKSILLLCYLFFVTMTVDIYSQNAKPLFKVVISSVRDAGEKREMNTDRFKVGEAVQIKVEITNLSDKRINIPKGGIGFSRPSLFCNGQLISYRQEVAKQFKEAEGGTLTGLLSPKPNESQTEILDLGDFYESLKPGTCHLSLERRFFKVNESPVRIESNAVLFEIVPNVKPDFRVIISTVSVSGEDETTPKDNFKVGEAIKLKVEITNLSDKRYNVPKGIDYSRPTLFRDGQLVPYRKEIIDREKRNYRSLTGMLYPKPNEMQTEVLDLNEYYEPLGPGKYQLSLERRFYKVGDIPSNAVMFEVTCGNK